MQELEPHPLLDAIEAFCAETGMSRSDFGEKAVRDPNFVFDLERGRDPRRPTIARVKAFMQETRS